MSRIRPRVILAKLGSFNLLNRIFPHVYISAEVRYEVVTSGAGLPGASEVAGAEWIRLKPLVDHVRLLSMQGEHPLGLGELSTILLAKEIQASTVLLDDYKARKLAKAQGLQVRGSIGLLETFYLRGHLTDLRDAFRQLLQHSYIDKRLLNHRLKALGLPSL